LEGGIVVKNKLAALVVSVGIATLSMSSHVLAMDGDFDRSAEVDRYVEVLRSGTQNAVTAALNEIYWSGISDRRLGDALNDLLLKDFDNIVNPPPPPFGRPRFSWTVDEKYGVGLIEALASMGMPEYNATFDKIAQAGKEKGAINKRIKKEAQAAPKLIAFRAGLNKAMASRESHVEGGNPTSSMLINLLKSDNRLYRDFALDRIHREKLRDPRLLDFLDGQVIAYVNRAPVKKLEWQDTYMRRNIKLLGLLGNATHHRTMEMVLASKVDEGAKKHAKVAASLLSTPSATTDAQ
jgi:hypothetical protein